MHAIYGWMQYTVYSTKAVTLADLIIHPFKFILPYHYYLHRHPVPSVATLYMSHHLAPDFSRFLFAFRNSYVTIQL